MDWLPTSASTFAPQVDSILWLVTIISVVSCILVGFLLIFPLTRNFILKIISSKFQAKKRTNEKFIDGEYEEIEKEDDKKL